MLGMSHDIRGQHVLLTIIAVLLVVTGTSARKILFYTDDCAACKKSTGDWARDYGYDVDSYIIETKDGYKLETFRIPHGKNREPGGVPVILEHGANGMSDNFILTMDGNNDTYATRLADSGYDVWFANNRGSRYARHENYSRLQFEYWNYTMDEWACIDIKATVDFVLAETKYPSVVLVGHSMAGALISMFLSEHPDYCTKVHYIQFLSPVVYIARNTILTPNPKVGGSLMGPVKVRFNEFLVEHGLLGGTFVDFSAGYVKQISQFCYSNNIIKRICFHLAATGVGFDPLSFNGMKKASEFELYLDDNTQELGIKYLTQSFQMNMYDRIQKYDYRKKNMVAYGTAKPPPYKFENIKTNIRIYHPKNDIFIDSGDNQRFFSTLTNANVSTHKMNYDHFNHCDYFYGLARHAFINLATSDIDKFHEEHPIKRPS